MPNIAIVWDFDGTLTPQDSTTKVVDILQSGKADDFWKTVKSLRGDGRRPQWRHILASDAPIWMYALSRIAFAQRVPLNTEFFEQFIKPHIELYPNVASFLRKLKLLEETKLFKAAKIEIHFFIVTAGLQELVELLLPVDLVRWTFGCRYQINAYEGDRARPESIPVFCMDETMKTRSLFEISKGSFADRNKSVNIRVREEDRWALFRDMIYVGDGDTDVPSLSLVRSQGGMGIAVYDPKKPKDAVEKRLRQMRLDRRADLITPANFDSNSELFNFLSARCTQIAQRYRAEQSV
jgi:2-hydroxy-3-keto-5-methylthiopentenyl-1-phosphate phosphatase